jgi:hypothetical protein
MGPGGPLFIGVNTRVSISELYIYGPAYFDIFPMGVLRPVESVAHALRVCQRFLVGIDSFSHTSAIRQYSLPYIVNRSSS